ncbi:cytochrome c oxidase subunit II [Duganella aceris]|uniref:C-type cytochrome n=1 Tax=Duganella aceris TaxID=2703883 RepID=A0ABX0FN09_9BURK|nr:c-type cytochrome [Duganella aceris]NGZ85819.1 c-type cytochrome [Duganella aceris]
MTSIVTVTSQSALHPAGPDAAIIAQLGWILFIGGGVVFVGVMLACALALRQGRPVRTRVWIVGAGVLLPLVVLGALLAFGIWRSAQLSQPSSRHTLKVAVIARMWWWEVRYTNPDGGEDIVLANEIRLPVGQPVYLGLSSGDVIHAFWVPALAGKVDMVPGRLHGMTLQADRAGVYRAQCAEYCGEQHARMALHVVAQPPAEFRAWLAAQARPARDVAAADPVIAQGRRAFAEQRCAACHTIRDASAAAAIEAMPAGIAPDLTHVGSRLYLGAGTLRNQPGALEAWIANPHAVKPGVRMPASADMDGATLRALAAYLEQLK